MRLIVIALFVAAALLVWLPFHTQTTLYETGSAGSEPAGQITEGFTLTQTVRPGPGPGPSPDSGPQHCFGIRFATYARSNAGTLVVGWQQDDRQQQWRVRAADLADNSFRYFCPEDFFSPREPFDLHISGVDGQPGSSATLWLVGDTRLGKVAPENGLLADGTSLALDVQAREPIAHSEMLRVNRGTFLLGWICTLLVGVVALTFAFGRSRRS